MLAIEELGLDYTDIKNVIINGFKSAFIPYRERVVLLNKALAEMEILEEEELKGKIKLADNI
jgi:adenosine deaminase